MNRIEACPVLMTNHMKPLGRRKIWIDLDNSPHVPFFTPIIEELERRGYSVILTAREAYQVCELAEFFHLTYIRVGHHYGKRKLLKIYGTCFRTLQLVPVAVREKPDLAVGHGSRSMGLACSLLGIPYIRICDYEFARFLPFFMPTWVMVPEVIPNSEVPVKESKILKYPGIKEDVYLPRFRPDDSIRCELGFHEDDMVVTIRPPANEAHYHNAESDELFKAVIEFLAQSPRTKMVLLPRNKKQAISVREAWQDLFSRGKILIPENAVDGLNLIWFSDLVISGGGTMNREAAALGVPVYSIFRGHIGAIDRYLSDSGRLVLCESVEDIRTKVILRRRTRPVTPPTGNSETLARIVEHIVSILKT